MTIPCPLCNGTGRRFDTDLGDWTDDTCTACQGLLVLETTDPDATQNTASRTESYRWWTDEELARLRRLRSNGVTGRAIADTLGRSYGSVRNKIAEMGLPCGSCAC